MAPVALVERRARLRLGTRVSWVRRRRCLRRSRGLGWWCVAPRNAASRRYLGSRRECRVGPTTARVNKRKTRWQGSRTVDARTRSVDVVRFSVRFDLDFGSSDRRISRASRVMSACAGVRWPWAGGGILAAVHSFDQQPWERTNVSSESLSHMASIAAWSLVVHHISALSPYQVFDRPAKRRQRDRAAILDAGSRSRTVDYVRDEVADRMMERLMVCACRDSLGCIALRPCRDARTSNASLAPSSISAPVPVISQNCSSPIV